MRIPLTGVLFFSFTVAFLFWHHGAMGQCSTPFSVPEDIGTTYGPTESTVLINLKAYILRRNNGSRGRSLEDVQKSLCRIRSEFAPHGIYFKTEIKYIDNNQIYWFNEPPQGSSGPSTFKIIKDLNNPFRNDLYDPDAINIYYVDFPVKDPVTGVWFPALFGGKASNIESKMCAVSAHLSPDHTQVDLLETHVPSHEIGHCLGLYHTFNGTCENFSNACHELNDGSNCTTCGDYICDTKPDPTYFNTWDSTTCTWQNNGTASPCTSFNGITDASGVLLDNGIPSLPYVPVNASEVNIMSYVWPSCNAIFTQGQENRMKGRLANNASLNDVLLSVDPAPYMTIGYDLMVRDNRNDVGDSPSPGFPADEGPDIWVRNSNDGFTVQRSEQLTYDGTDLYVYVRVINRGCEEFSADQLPGGGSLDLYWSRFGTAQSWPVQWDGTTYNHNNGDLIASPPLPSIPGGGSHIFEIPWDMSGYITSDPHSVQACLLARINNVPDDPVNQPGVSLYNEVKSENNLTLKNLVIYDAAFFKQATDNHVDIYVGGAELDIAEYDLAFTDKDLDLPIFDEAEVLVKLDELAWGKWESVQFQAEFVDIVSEIDRIVRLTRSGARLIGLSYAADERSVLELTVTFPEEGGSAKNQFNFFLEQTISGAVDEDESVIGTAGFEIYKEHEESLKSDHEKQPTLKSERVITANGIDLISPNPAQHLVTVKYRTKMAGTAYLVIIENGSGSSVSKYLLNTAMEEIVIDVSKYAPGSYTLALVCDGQLGDAVSLIIE